jgi:hypothetical protein
LHLLLLVVLRHLLVRRLNLEQRKLPLKALSLRLAVSLTHSLFLWLQRLALPKKLLEMWYRLHSHQ